MQNLFALEQCKEADYQLSLDHINERFEPDLTSMEVQDKAGLKKQKQLAIKLFEESFSNNIFSVTDEDASIEKAVNDSFILYNNLISKDTDFFFKNLIVEIEKIYERYIEVLALVASFAEVAASDKKVNHENFVSNAWIKAFHSSEQLKKESLKLNRHWNTRMDKVKTWFRDVIRQDGEYQIYLDKAKPSLEVQKKYTNHLFKKVILGNTVIKDYFEEEVLRWAEDQEIIKGLIEKTLKAFNPENQTPILLHALSLNWEEDREFIEKLYKNTVGLEPKYRELIAQNTRNWEVDRLPLTDRIILSMAIAELLNFPSIPIKVTINEYIELAKNYSTPKSRQFINGILDVIAKELREEGEIKKSGRGLIDNK